MHVSAATLDRLTDVATFTPNYVGMAYGVKDTDVVCTYCLMGDWLAPAHYATTTTTVWDGNLGSTTEHANLCTDHLVAWMENIRDTGK